MEFRDLKKQYEVYKKQIDNSIQEVLNESNYISGPQVKNFEERLATYVGVKHCVSCANGTDALALVLHAWGITKGDAVFVPNFTFFATAEVVSQVGATPVFVDVEPETFNMDPRHLEIQIKKTIKESQLKPKVIITVDLFGLLADYSRILPIANKYGLKVLEDAAQAFGAEYNGKRACSFADAATTSFFPAKPLGCYGDGGAIFTDDDELVKILHSLRVHGKGDDKYDNVRIGFNSRLDTIQAAILNVKLDAFINHELEDVNKVYGQYDKLLRGIVTTPIIPQGYLSSFAQYTIKLKSKEQRDGLKDYLTKQDIPTMIYYTKTMHQQTAYKTLNNNDNDFPISTNLCKLVLSIPIHPYLSNKEISKIVQAITNYVKNEQFAL